MEKIVKKHGLVFSSFLLLGFLLFYKIGDNLLTHWDEAWYADISRNVVKSANLLTFTWNSEPFFDKPPLYFWLSGLMMKLLGFTELSARLPSVLSAFGAFIVLYWLGRFLFNRVTAFLSLVVLGTTIGFLFRARSGNLDTLLTLWILVSMLSFYKAYQSRSKKWFLIMGLGLGLGFLTKGVIVFLFPLICLLYFLVRKEYVLLKPQLFLGSILIGIAISLTWIFVSFFSNGHQFIEDFITNQLGKISTSSSFWRNFSFEYIWHLKSGLKLWFVPFVGSILYGFVQWKNSSKVIIVIYFLSLFTVLSFSENKSNWFLMPLYPITALLIADSFSEIRRRFFKKSGIFIPVLLFIALLQIFIYRNDYVVPDITSDDARVAMAAKNVTDKDDILYLTNYYYPAVVYYSERKTYAVYSEHEKNQAWWIRPKTDWENILRADRVFVITTDEEFENLNTYFAKYKFQLLYQSGTKKLLKKV